MKEKMLAIMKDKPREGAITTEVAIPKIKPHEILVKVKATSICGTDVHIYKWDKWSQNRIKPPLIFGHEFTGEVIEIGKHVFSTSEVKVGNYVSAETHIACGKCFQCKTGNAHICENVRILGVDTQGCFAEYAVIPAANAWVNDPKIPLEIASMQEPLGNAIHTALAVELIGNTVLIMGCGPIGLCSIQVAKAAGAAKVIAVDLVPYRLELAKKMKADYALNAREVDVIKEVMDITEGKGADVFLEMSGSQQAIEQGFKALRPGGEASILGIPSKEIELDLSSAVVFKAAKVHGINGRLMFNTWYKTASLLKNKLIDISPIITHKIKLNEFEQGMQAMLSGNSGKVVMFP
ncbi:MAG: L-threonine 3-dehydrogenase [Candidatus Diapherotrites archaeon]